MMPVATSPPVVLVVEDDSSIREALARLFTTVGMEARTYASATELLNAELPDAPSCLVLDIRLPGRSGLALQEELTKAGVQIPIVFMTGFGDIPMSVRAMKAGAVDFLTKPFRDQDMLDAVAAATTRGRERQNKVTASAALKADFKLLTPREREVMLLATSGLMNKQIAAELNLSEVTVKIHRGNVMRKMRAGSLPELVRMVDALGLGEQRHL